MLCRRCSNNATKKLRQSQGFFCILLTPAMKHLCLENNGMWCLTVLENGQPAVKRHCITQSAYERQHEKLHSKFYLPLKVHPLR